MGKTPSPGKWIKSLLGKKSSKSSLEKGSQKLRSAKKEELLLKNNNVSNLLAVPQEDEAIQTVIVLDVVIDEKLVPSGDIAGDESNLNIESRNDSEELKLEEAATKVQTAFRAHQVRGEFQNHLIGIIKLQAVIRGHLVRRQAVATYSCIWGIVKLQALVRGKQARSSETGVQLQNTNMETDNSETLQGSSWSWMKNPTKLFLIDKLLILSPTALPLKIQYSHEDPNSAMVWLERWTQLQIWAPGPLMVKSLVPKSQIKKRSFQAVELGKGRLKRGVKNPSAGLKTGNSSSSRSTAENEKPKRNVRKDSTFGKELSRIENDKSKQSSRKSTSVIKEGLSMEVKDEKPRISLKKTSVSNVLEKATRKPAEKKKEIADSVQKEVPADKVLAYVDEAPKKADLDEIKTVERSDKVEEEIQEQDVQISSENGNVASENIKTSDRRASLPAKIENHHNQDDGLLQSGRKIPSYMAPTASAKARVKEGSLRNAPEKNGTTRRHSLPHATNGKLSTMSPRAHRLLMASGKGSMNSDRSFSSSKDIADKSTKVEWKR